MDGILDTAADYLGITDAEQSASDAVQSQVDTGVAKAQQAAQQTINKSLPAAQATVAAGIAQGAATVERQLAAIGIVGLLVYFGYRYVTKHHLG